MSDKVPVCQCGMFRQKGICWHTGYRPTFRDERPSLPKIPEAVLRMHNRVLSNMYPDYPSTEKEKR